MDLLDMTSTYRDRTRVAAPYDGGSYSTFYNGSFVSTVYGPSTTIGRYERCQDYTMPPPYTEDHPLTVYKATAGPCRVVGAHTNPGNPKWTATFNGYLRNEFSERLFVPAPTSFDASYWETLALANLNPYRPAFDLPLFLFELKDMPDMLRQAGKFLKGEVSAIFSPSNNVLAYNLGWAPLVSDVQSMFSLSKALENRTRYFENLESGVDVKRRLTQKGGKRLVENQDVGGMGMDDYYVGHIYDGRKLKSERLDVWFTANAKLKHPLPKTPNAYSDEAKDAITGLNLKSAYRLWDFLPWSWLSDYFVNVGDFLEAHNGLVYTTVSRMNLMAKSTVEVKFDLRHSNGVTVEGGLLKGVTKRRFPYSDPVPWVTMRPFLTGTMMANLGALATRAGFSRL